jgi:hypothetical protein
MAAVTMPVTERAEAFPASPIKNRCRQMSQVHPAAELFPLLGKEDLLALAADRSKKWVPRRAPKWINHDAQSTTAGTRLQIRNRHDAVIDWGPR